MEFQTRSPLPVCSLLACSKENCIAHLLYSGFPKEISTACLISSKVFERRLYCQPALLLAWSLLGFLKEDSNSTFLPLEHSKGNSTACLLFFFTNETLLPALFWAVWKCTPLPICSWYFWKRTLLPTCSPLHVQQNTLLPAYSILGC